MNVQFLGTSASPSIPMPFCHCNVCVNARKIGGKNLRKRSSIKINEDMLIDIGPDIMSSSSQYSISISNISICLQTHFHEDHFDPEMIISRHNDYGSVILNDLLLVSSQQTLEMMDVIISRRCDYGSIFDSRVQADLKIRLLPIAPFESYSIGDYTVTGFPANHGSKQQGCLLYKIEYENKCVFYGTDTSVLFDEVWDTLSILKSRFDLIILDHTYGVGHDSKPGDHLAIKDFISHVQRFISSDLLNNKGQIYATHISHEGIDEHSELDIYARKNNYHIAYDGLVIEIE